MKTAFILHGVCDRAEYLDIDFPSPSNAHWLPWLQQMFLRSGVLAQCLEMPVPYAPVYEDWVKVWERQDIRPDSIVVGHSAGCGFILKWLAQNPDVRLSKLVLVAPWRDPQREAGEFVQGPLDGGLVARVGEMHILASGDDMEDVVASVGELTAFYKEAHIHRFEKHGHFCAGDIGLTFDALWQIAR